MGLTSSYAATWALSTPASIFLCNLLPLASSHETEEGNAEFLWTFAQELDEEVKGQGSCHGAVYRITLSPLGMLLRDRRCNMTGVMIGVMVVFVLVGMLGLGGHHGSSSGHHGKMDGNEKREAVTQYNNRDIQGDKSYPNEDISLRDSKREITVAKNDADDEKGLSSGDAANKVFEEATK